MKRILKTLQEIDCKKFLVASAGGAALGASLNIAALWPLVFIGLAALYGILSASPLSWGRAFGYGYTFGIFYLGGALWWFWDTIPLDWLGFGDTWMQFVIIFFCWGIVVVALSLCIAAAAAIVVLLRSGTWAADTLLFAATWVFVAEYLRMWMFTLLTWGGGSVLGAHFSAGFVGYALSNHMWLLQLAAVGGVFTLSFAAAFAGSTLWWVYAKLQPRAEYALPAVALGILFLGVTAAAPFPLVERTPPAPGELQVALVGTYFPATLENNAKENDRRLQQLLPLVKEAAATDADLIVLPEDVRLFDKLDTWERTDFSEGLSTHPRYLLDTHRVAAWGGSHSQLVLYSLPDGKPLHTSEKHFLLPPGEYTPVLLEMFMKLLGLETQLRIIQGNRSFQAGTPSGLYSVGEARIGALFCAEILSPSLYAALAERGASILINPASQAWFHESPRVFHQTLAAAKVHAVTNRTYFLQASNYAPTFAIAPSGDIVAYAPAGETILLIAVPYR